MITGVQGFPSVPGSKCKIRKNPLQLKLFGEFQNAFVLHDILSSGFKKHVFYMVSQANVSKMMCFTRYPKPKFQKACVLHGVLSQSFKKHMFYTVS